MSKLARAVWMWNWLSEVDLQVTEPIELFCDNNGAINLSEVSKGHSLSKHIDIRFHYIRDEVEKGTVKAEFVASEDNPADLLTKPLVPLLHRRQVGLIGLGEVEVDRV